MAMRILSHGIESTLVQEADGAKRSSLEEQAAQLLVFVAGQRPFLKE